MKNFSKIDILFSLWIISLLTIPFDSFPFIKGGYIKPLSIIPMAIMIFLVFLTVLIGKKKIFINKSDIIFIFFTLYIFVNSLFQLIVLQNAVSESGITPLRRFLEVLYFLPLIIVFYFTPRLAILDIKKLEKTFKWLILAFVIPLCWGILQSIFILAKWDWYNSIFGTINQSLANKTGVIGSRIALFSAEPSAASYQLVFLLFPILTICLHFDFSFFRKIKIPFMIISLESLLLLTALFCLVMTVSLTGFFSAMFFLLFYFIIFLKKKKFYKIIVKFLLIIIILIIITYSYFQDLINRLNSIFLIDNFNIVSSLIKDGSLAARATSWVVGIKEFLMNILIGVGFRNTMFYYTDLVPDWAYQFIEVQLYLTSSNPTPKGFFQGILGELGLIGLGLFIILYIGLIQGLRKIKPESNLLNVIKYSLFFNLLLIIPIGTSTDFSHPYFWFIFGITSAFISVNKVNTSNKLT